MFINRTGEHDKVLTIPCLLARNVFNPALRSPFCRVFYLVFYEFKRFLFKKFREMGPEPRQPDHNPSKPCGRNAQPDNSLRNRHTFYRVAGMVREGSACSSRSDGNPLKQYKGDMLVKMGVDL